MLAWGFFGWREGLGVRRPDALSSFFAGEKFCAVARNKAVSIACRRPSYFSLLAHATAGAVANGEAGPKGGGQDARSQEK